MDDIDRLRRIRENDRKEEQPFMGWKGYTAILLMLAAAIGLQVYRGGDELFDDYKRPGKRVESGGEMPDYGRILEPADAAYGGKMTQEHGSKGQAKRPGPPAKPAPDFSATTIDGEDICLGSYRGDVLLIDFWATWCGPCTAELPDIARLEKKYRNKGFRVLGVSLDRDEGALRRYMEENGIGFKQVFCPGMRDDPFVRAFGVTSIPTNFLVGRDGELIAEDVHGEQLELHLERLFEE